MKRERVALREQGLRLYINTIGYNRKYRGRPRERQCVALKSGDRDFYQLFILLLLLMLVFYLVFPYEQMREYITHRLLSNPPTPFFHESTMDTRAEPVNWIIKFDIS